ncbi:hypothetical protein [Rugosimonospora africana]|uniref:Peptidase C39-like domain-containing protein n=1 Tax=Rugosimonospora africana TaxID=556532 RepID=A0A8J3QMQ0_9ACTN|nr:hypothetical protein [Rugosimonospora africana]GIH12368.1 hypothetical protein Raf01_05400 [Rugosimonospora africana]
MPDTAFRAGKNGFHFPNNFVNHIVTLHVPLHGAVDVTTGGRCGGMAYAALDYFHAGLPVPTHETGDFADGVPPDGSVLAGYIYHRLIDSFLTGSATKFIAWTLRPDHDILRLPGVHTRTSQELVRIRRSIDRGDPVVLGLLRSTLLTDLGDNHQVVCYGYDGDELHIYDNRCPDVEGTVTRRPDGSWSLEAGDVQDRWRGLFAQDYRPAQPPYHDLMLTSGLTVEPGAPVAGAPFRCGYQVRNVGEFTAHADRWHLSVRGPGGEDLDATLVVDAGTAGIVEPGQTVEVSGATPGLGGPGGEYTLCAGFVSTNQAVEVLPASGPARNRLTLSVAAAGSVSSEAAST